MKEKEGMEEKEEKVEKEEEVEKDEKNQKVMGEWLGVAIYVQLCAVPF